jgi:hypothetical protein
MPTPAVTKITVYDQYGLPFPVFMDTMETNTGVSGTATPVAALIPRAQSPLDGSQVTTIAGYPFNEEVDSPLVEVAEQCTTTKTFVGPYSYAADLMPLLARGALLADQEGNFTRILTTRLQRMRTTLARLTIVTESVSFDTPPDLFSCTPVELGINIMKHPRYFYALYPDPATDTTVQMQVKQAIIRAIQTYQDSPYFPTTNTLSACALLSGQVQNVIAAVLVNGKFIYTIPNPNYQPQFPATNTAADQVPNATPPKATVAGQANPQVLIVSFDPTVSGTDPHGYVALALAAAGEIIQKLWRIEDNPYTVGWQISWTTYYYRPPFLTPGGYLQDPIVNTGEDNPGLPDYFYSTANPPDTLSPDIFSEMAALNPQCYSSDGTPTGVVNISWLRKADDYDYERTWFKVTRTWIGSAIGHWDEQLFGGGVPANNYSPNRPSKVTDYLPLH